VILNRQLMRQLPELIRAATEWATAEEARALSAGRFLDPGEVSEAVSVGVACPERVRLCVVRTMPKPDHALLVDAMKQTNFLGDGTLGLTLGYATIFLSGHENLGWLLRHELRHVAQYEHAGSIGRFLQEYLEQVLSVGYREAPLEADARRYEKRIGMTG
jgi:hypothetical protein